MKHLTDLQKLKFSVYFGWIVMGFFIIILPVSNFMGDYSSSLFVGILITGLLLSIRYSMIKPVLKAAAGGATVVGIASIIESVFHRRASGVTLGAFVGAMLVVIAILLKNTVVSSYLLTKETVTLIRVRKEKGIFSVNEEVAVTSES